MRTRVEVQGVPQAGRPQWGMNAMRDHTESSDVSTASARSARNRGHSQRGRRRGRVVLRYDDSEWLVVEQAAALEGLRPGAFASRTTLDASRMRVNGVLLDRNVLTTLYEALTQHSNQLVRIGANLNNVAWHANSTHEMESVRRQALAVLRLVRIRVAESRNLLAELRYALR